MDGDLQDPPEILPDLVAPWRNGYDVVYAVRTGRKEPLIKRLGYAMFYRALRAMSDLDIPLDSGDFGLMDHRVVDELRRLPERTRFVRGLRAFVGFRQIGLVYTRNARFGGVSKYSMAALIRLATDGLVSFSSYPLHLATYVGLTVAASAAALGIWVCLDAVYGSWTVASSLPLMTLAGLERLRTAGSNGDPDADWPHRLRTIQVTALAFALVFCVQSDVWHRLSARLRGTLAAGPAGCVSREAAPWLAQTPLYHGATPAYAIVLQGRGPRTLLLEQGRCEEARASGAVWIALEPFAKDADHWFDFAHPFARRSESTSGLPDP